MAFSLYAATIPSYIQILGAVAGLIDKAEAFCTEKGLMPQDIIQARLAADMQPFAYQVKSTVVHSLGAIEGVRKEVFSPDMTTLPQDFAALKARIIEAIFTSTPQPHTTFSDGRASRSASATLRAKHASSVK
jgi:uncharacterized protein